MEEMPLFKYLWFYGARPLRYTDLCNVRGQASKNAVINTMKSNKLWPKIMGSICNFAANTASVISWYEGVLEAWNRWT